MQELKTVARPYAKALFSIAQTEGQCSVWCSVLQVLACTVEQKGFVPLTLDPDITEQQMVAFLVSLIEEFVSDTQPIQDALRSFVSVLFSDKRLLVVPYVLEIFHQLWVDSQDAVLLEITSAYPLSEVQQRGFNQALENRFNAAVEISFKIDPALIGGAVIRRGSWVMDGSIRGKLTNLIDSMRG